MQERFDKALDLYKSNKNDIKSLWVEFCRIYRLCYELRKKILPILVEIKNKNIDFEFNDISLDFAVLKRDNPEDIETQTMLQTIVGNNVYVDPMPPYSPGYDFDPDLLSG